MANNFVKTTQFVLHSNVILYFEPVRKLEFLWRLEKEVMFFLCLKQKHCYFVLFCFQIPCIKVKADFSGITKIFLPFHVLCILTSASNISLVGTMQFRFTIITSNPRLRIRVGIV